MLQIRNLTKVFSAGTGAERKAVTNINLSVESGEFLCLIGGNGAGKTTLMNLVAGTYMPDSGRITLERKDITYLSEHKRAKQIGHLFQDPLLGTAPNMTIEENLSLAYLRGKRRGLKRAVSKKNAPFFKEQLRLLDLGLEDRLKTQVGLLSGGQRQAITLLMATLAAPTLLLLDEHTAALDPATADKVLCLTENIQRESKITTLMITHNIESALRAGTRTLMLQQGKIILDIKGKEREEMTVERLLRMFRQKSGKSLNNDRMLLS